MIATLFIGCQSQTTDKSANEEGFPTKKTVEIVAPVNSGGKGLTEWNMLIEREDSHIAAMDSAYIYLNDLLGVEGNQKYTDVKPIANLINEWIGIFVKSDSKLQNVNDVM